MPGRKAEQVELPLKQLIAGCPRCNRNIIWTYRESDTEDMPLLVELAHRRHLEECPGEANA